MKRTISIMAIAMGCFFAQAKAQTVKQHNITPLTNSLNIVTNLKPVNFSYDPTWAEKLRLKGNPQSGFNMEDLDKNYPSLVINQQLNYNSGKNNTKTAVVTKVDYEALIPLLVGSIKEQQQQIEALKAEINSLKGKTAK